MRTDCSFSRLWLLPILIIASITMLLGLGGCATFEKNLNSERLLVQVATMKVIESGKTDEARKLKAEHIVTIAGDAKTFLHTDSATIDLLKDRVNARIAALNLEPSDRLLAGVLVDTVVDELQTRVVNGVKIPVPPEQLVYQVDTVLGWIIDSARVYQ